MAGAAFDTVNVEDVDRFLSGIEGRPVRIAGRPGVLIATPPVPGVAAGRPRGYLLVEGEDGLPTAKYVDLGPGKVLDDGMESLHPRPDAHLGQTLARGFLGGGSIARHLRIAMHAHTRAAFDADLGRIQATISGHAVHAFAHAGFSPAFRDALGCLAHWPAIEDGSSLWPMYDAGPPGERLRAHCRAFPFTSILRYEDLWQDAMAGAIPAPGLPPALLARLAGPAWIPGSPELHEVVGQLSERPGGLGTLLDALTEIPLDWVPTTARQAEDFVRVVTLAHHASGVTGNAFGGLVASAKGDWTAFLERCMPGRGLLEYYMLGDAYAGNLRDPIRALAAGVTLPLLLRRDGPGSHDADIAVGHPAYAAAAEIIYRGKGLPACVEVAGRWHAMFWEIDGSMPDGTDPDARWPALAPDKVVQVVSPAGKVPCMVTCLTSARDLSEEGARGPDRNGVPGLGHCVASYRGRARRGACHILSVRRVLPGGGYARLATAEVRPKGYGSSVEVVQVQGPAETLAVAKSAVRAWLVMSRGYPVPRPRPADERRDSPAEGCEYDWRADAQVAQAVAAYAPLLPRPLRSLSDLEAWMSEMSPASVCAAP